MLSIKDRKLIFQLSKKKYRLLNKLFVAEGEKTIQELISNGWKYEMLFSTKKNLYPDSRLIKLSQMKQITHFKTPSPVLGVFNLPQSKRIMSESTTIAIDGISDPGNLGTIIRLCDWFGLSQILCSNETVDCYNPKVIQASMGSIVRVRCHYLDNLGNSLKSLKKPIFGASLNGKSIYEHTFNKKATYIFGSESHGISKDILKNINCELTIPHFRTGKLKPDSLNVASSVAIFLSELSKA